MSSTDPYMALSVEEARFDVEAPVEAAPAPEEAPAPKAALDVPEGSIKEVLTWVGDDAEKAKAALEAEEKGENRKTLVTKLKEISE